MSTPSADAFSELTPKSPVAPSSEECFSTPVAQEDFVNADSESEYEDVEEGNETSDDKPLTVVDWNMDHFKLALANLDLDATTVTSLGGANRVISSKPLTEPQEFHSHYEQLQKSRKSRKPVAEATATTPVQYRFKARKTPNSALYNRLSKQAMRSDRFVALAELVAKYLNATPERFHSKPVGSDTYVAPPRASPLKPTVPITPTFATDQRARPTTVLSTEEMILSQFTEFKASEINPKVFESCGDYGVPRVPKRPPTEPHEFHFHWDTTAHKREATVTEEPAPFHAQSIPAGLFDRQLGVPEKKILALTVPESPAITKPALDRTAFMPHAEPEYTFKAHPAPDFSKVFEPVHSTKVCVPEPFAAADLYEDVYQKREVLAAEERAKLASMRDFHARPMPDFTEPVHDVPSAPVTVPQPFALEGEAIHENYQRTWTEKVAKEQEEALSRANFKAQAVMKGEVFQPLRSKKPLTDIVGFNLHAEARLQQRHEFDERLRAKELAKQEMERQQAQERERREQEEIAMLRKATVHKARGVRKFKAWAVKPSAKPLTMPMTPTVAKRDGGIRA